MASYSFCALPADLRFDIYAYLFPPGSRAKLRQKGWSLAPSTTGRHFNFVPGKDSDCLKGLAILGANKQIRGEAYQIFKSNVRVEWFAQNMAARETVPPVFHPIVDTIYVAIEDLKTSCEACRVRWNGLVLCADWIILHWQSESLYSHSFATDLPAYVNNNPDHIRSLTQEIPYAFCQVLEPLKLSQKFTNSSRKPTVQLRWGAVSDLKYAIKWTDPFDGRKGVLHIPLGEAWDTGAFDRLNGAFCVLMCSG